VLRGWDEGHQTQPDKPTWNLMGMLNNPWFRVKIFKSIGGTGNTILTFEHPTLAGNQNGGWMPKMREHPALTTPGVYVDPITLIGEIFIFLNYVHNYITILTFLRLYHLIWVLLCIFS
jgi:hypothetical protein